ncbi:TorF family putative porin, partial [Xanthomonas maliensis]
MKLFSPMCCALLLSSVAPLAHAEEASTASPLSGTFAVTSDYVFRGISQTNGDPAFQAGLTYKHPSGFYAAAWTSNVDPGEGDPDWEVDG